MADELREAFGVESELIAGKGGIFEVIADGNMVFAKRKLGRFPKEGEVVAIIKEQA